MNKMYSLSLIPGLFLFSVTSTLAENSLVSFPDGPAAWTVDVTVSPKENPPDTMGPSEVVKVDVAQSDRIRENNVMYVSGASRVTWSVTGTNLLLTEDPKGTAFLTPVSKFFFVPYLPSTFDWINPSFQQEKTPISYAGKMCLHYKGTPGEAWVDFKTLLPVAFDDGVRMASFTFHQPPDTPVALPQKFQQILDKYIAIMGQPHGH